MNTLPRDVAQLLITKLDTNAVSPTEAKEFAKRWHRIDLTGRTREQVIRSISAQMAAA